MLPLDVGIRSILTTGEMSNLESKPRVVKPRDYIQGCSGRKNVLFNQDRSVRRQGKKP